MASKCRQILCTIWNPFACLYIFPLFRQQPLNLQQRYAATIKFNTVEERLYREAIGIMLGGIDPVLGIMIGSGY